MADPHQIWQEKFAARHAAERVAENERRNIAFLDITHEVCGEQIRCMTARDLLILDGIENPFVAGGQIRPAHIPQFLWHLNRLNDPSRPVATAFRKGRMIGRLRKANYARCIKEVSGFVDMMFLDSPAGGASKEEGERRGLQTCFLAPLLVRLASEMGALDPASGVPFIESPLPRLFQYMKTLRSKAEGKDFIDTSPSDRLLDDWLIEVNAQMGAEQLKAQEGKT